MPDAGFAHRFAHKMPFGATLLDGGGVAFRLWAPDAARVELALEGGATPRLLPMEKRGKGWFELTVADAGPGTRYRFRPETDKGKGLLVPDPASRWQPFDVHGPSVVVDPRAYSWNNPEFRGRPWEETILYELHVGTFTPEGTYRAAMDKLDHLESLGVTAVELLPLAEFAGRRGWGYDGVQLFAPESGYGGPDELKALVDAIHERGMTAWLDVVYNHFGPEGNYLHAYASCFFTRRHATPWGPAVNVGGKQGRPVRDFLIHNALYWLEEYRFDGLRLDAVQEIRDESEPHFLRELAETVKARLPDRHVHLVLENDLNQARWLERDGEGRPRLYAGQWNDDWHHSAHLLATGEDGGYYADHAGDPAGDFLKALTRGFTYEGARSAYRGRDRGEPGAHLTPTSFVNYLQNHDQVGNRPRGDRLTALAEPRAVRALTAILLLQPHIPMLWMGQEWGAPEPFLFFCDFHGDLAEGVRRGRKQDFRSFHHFEPQIEGAPDPLDEATFSASRLDWGRLTREEHEDWLAYHSVLLQLRRTALVPRLAGMGNTATEGVRLGDRALRVAWTLADGEVLTLLANLGPEPHGGFPQPAGDLLFESEEGAADALMAGGDALPGWTALWFLTLGEGKGRSRAKKG
ncbi:MAG TPA: malto-oligosyltrehalose trehalohydrolase [Azospirillaceae bacterium]|nr:malto-oligosyltrehalose trehalohydrolase [Azospirillaceae bacterium]